MRGLLPFLTKAPGANLRFKVRSSFPPIITKAVGLKSGRRMPLATVLLVSHLESGRGLLSSRF